MATPVSGSDMHMYCMHLRTKSDAAGLSPTRRVKTKARIGCQPLEGALSGRVVVFGEFWFCWERLRFSRRVSRVALKVSMRIRGCVNGWHISKQNVEGNADD